MSEDIPELDALKAYDVVAWRKAYPHFWPVALHAARHPIASLSPWQAEDVAGDAVGQLMSQINTVASINQAKGLLAVIACRRAIDFRRRRGRENPLVTELESTDESSRHSTVTALDIADVAALLQQAIDVLEPETQTILIEKFAYGFTYEEISKRRGIKIGTLCPKIQRALMTIREYLRNSPALVKELEQFLR